MSSAARAPVPGKHAAYQPRAGLARTSRDIISPDEGYTAVPAALACNRNTSDNMDPGAHLYHAQAAGAREVRPLALEGDLAGKRAQPSAGIADVLCAADDNTLQWRGR